MKLSVNDWQDFSLKKDIEKLNKLVQRVSKTGSTVIFDILVVLGAVIFDRFSEFTNRKITGAIYIFAVFLIIAPLVRLLCKKIKAFRHGKFTSIVSRDIREYIDCFDNEIWVYVMMSDSFLELLKDITTTDNHRKTFYFSQTCFWLNKAIMKLHEMIQKLNKIFSNDNKEVVNNRKVATARLVNLLDIIFNIKKAVNEKKDGLTLSEEDLTANSLYNDILNDFLAKAFGDLGIDIERFRI